MARRSQPRAAGAAPAEGFLAAPLRNLGGGLIYMLVVMAAATTAYVSQRWPLDDAVYMVVLTVFTVGYEEVRPIDTPALRGITIGLIVLGCTGVIFLTGVLVQLITATQLQQVFGLKRMENQIERLNGHVIVCGFGRLGVMLARDLTSGGAAFIILERNAARIGQARELGYLVLEGDATDEDLLRRAGVGRARCLATVLPDDAANVFITLSARSLNQALTIIARGEMPSTESKLLQAGANRVVLPAHIGAERIAEIILFPVADKMLHGSEFQEDFARQLRRLGLEIEVVPVQEGSPAAGRSIEATEREAGGAFLIVGLNRRSGETLVRPPGDVVVEAGDGALVVARQARGRVATSLFQRS